MARKPAKTFGTSKLSLWTQILEITGPFDDGSLSKAQMEKVLGLWVRAASEGEKLLWAEIAAGVAEMPSDADAALLLLAIYTKLAMEATGGVVPESTDTSPEEVVPVMGVLLNLPGWEPSARWPFSKEEMSQCMSRLGSYLTEGAGSPTPKPKTNRMMN